MHQPSLDIFMRLAGDLDTEGRYLFLNALANQLRYPNNHTHYFSCILLYLFNETTQVGLHRQQCIFHSLAVLCNMCYLSRNCIWMSAKHVVLHCCCRRLSKSR